MRQAQVIVTRPAREAAQWVAQLGAHGIAATALPLIAIVPCQDAAAQAALGQARAQLGSYQAVMFVSGNAVHYFFESNWSPAPDSQALEAIKTRVWAPGPGTALSLLQAGFAPERIDRPAPDAEQFDSEALWQQVAAQVQPGARILIVRGRQAGAGQAAAGQGRDWLARQIEAAGGQVDCVVAYERAAPRFTPGQMTLAQTAARAGSWWLLSSSEAVAHLAAAAPGLQLDAARALATHPRIAAAARTAGFGLVRACRPALADIVASIESAP